MERRDTILLILALAAAVLVVSMRHHIGMRVAGRPAIADNEHMLNAGDDAIVGDSNVQPNPVSRVALANTRFGPVPCMPALRQVSRGRMVHAQILNEAHHE